MKIIITLGNPTEKYKNTRHNVGFMVADFIVKKYNATFKTYSKFKADISEFLINDEKIIIVKPQTYMNLSGEAVSLVMNYFKCSINDLLIIFDDISLDLGCLRFRVNGSDGGHNGIKSIIQHLGGDNKFSRLKVGIGPQPPYLPAEKYVLADFSKDETTILQDIFPVILQSIECYIQSGIDDTQNKFNGKIDK